MKENETSEIKRGYQTYLDVKNELRGKIGREHILFDLAYYKSNIISFSIAASDLELFMEYRIILKSTLKIFIRTNVDIECLIKYLIKYKQFHIEPKLIKQAYITREELAAKEGFVYTKNNPIELLEKREAIIDDIGEKFDIDKTLKEIDKIKYPIDINYDTGEILLRLPLPFSNNNSNELINEIIEVIFEDKSEIIKKYTALYAFEDRYGKSIPTLILTGKRGVGKGIFAETLLSSIYPGATVPIPENFESFGYFLTNKLVLIDESTSEKLNLSRIYDWCKKLSGQRIASVNIKNRDVFNILSGTFIVIMSNEKPLHVKDQVFDSLQNQFLMIEIQELYKNQTPKRIKIAEIKKKINLLGYNDFYDFFRDNITHYIRTFLLDIYKQIKLEQKEKFSRYGFEIPITEEFKQLLEASITDTEEKTMIICQDLMNQNSEGYYFDQLHQRLFESFVRPFNLGFVASKLIQVMCDIKKMTVRQFCTFADKHQFRKDSNVKQTIAIREGVSQRFTGHQMNIEKLKQYFTMGS